MMKYALILLPLLLALSCKKADDWLNVKSQKGDVTPTSLPDYQALLDNTTVLNSDYPTLSLVSADNFYLGDAAWQAAGTATERNAYLWAPDIYSGDPGFDWNKLYQKVATANIVLEGLQKLPPSPKDTAAWNAARGSALFFRSYSFYHLLGLFTLPYSASSTALGIPLRLSADVTQKVGRAPLQACYQQVISDLEKAVPLLPLQVTQKTRPSRAAAYALLARLFLSMGRYPEALQQATSSLQLQGDLLDFTLLDTTSKNPFPTYQKGNPEVLFYATVSPYSLDGSSPNCWVDTTLYRSYGPSDLRKSLFYFPGPTGINFKGYYNGNSFLGFFAGLQTGDLYLIRAEAEVRGGNTQAALDDLETLLTHRYKMGTYTRPQVVNADSVLTLVLQERRKELPFSGMVRWEDLRRLSPDPSHAVTPTRRIGGQTYHLLPGDARYALPIPLQEIKLNSIEQNPR